MGKSQPEGRPSIVFTSPTCRFPPVPHGQSEYLYLCQPAKRGSFEATLLRFPMWSCADAAALWLATETQRRPRHECHCESQGGLPFTRHLPPPHPFALDERAMRQSGRFPPCCPGQAPCAVRDILSRLLMSSRVIPSQFREGSGHCRGRWPPRLALGGRHFVWP